MRWAEARARSLGQWEAIHRGIGQVDASELIGWIHAAYGLCERAAEETREAGETGLVCRFCLAFRQQGGCEETRERMIDALLSGDLLLARSLAETLILRLQDLDMPAEP